MWLTFSACALNVESSLVKMPCKTGNLYGVGIHLDSLEQ